MKTSELEALLHSITPGLYRFAFSLIPEELQAQQLVVDCISVICTKDRELLLRALSGYNPEEKDRTIELICRRRLHRIAEKRVKHLGAFSMDNIPFENKPFYQLGFKERSVLFLMQEYQAASTC